MKKPTMQPEVAIASIFLSGDRCSYFYATQDAATKFKQFGEVRHVRGDLYVIEVDASYNVEEVIAYINCGVVQ